MNENLAKVMENSDYSSDKSGGEGASAEKPNLTLLEKGQNPGAVLRSAREKMGLSLREISTRTKINERNLTAIENGDKAALPPDTFAKAFIKSYAKVVRLDPAPLIASFGYEEQPVSPAPVRAEQADASATRLESAEPRMPGASRRLASLHFDGGDRNRSLIYFVGLGFAVLAAVFYLPALIQQDDKPQATQLPESAGMPPAAEPQANAAPSEVQASPAQAESTAAPSVAPVAEAPAQAAAPAVVAAAAPSVTTPTPVVPAAPTAVAVPAVAPTAAPAVSTTPTVGQSTLKFQFTDQSWVTVRDASNTVLISQLNQPGSNLDVVGQGPLKVIIGNAKAVTMNHNGRPVELNTHAKGDVVRLLVQ